MGVPQPLPSLPAMLSSRGGHSLLCSAGGVHQLTQSDHSTPEETPGLPELWKLQSDWRGLWDDQKRATGHILLLPSVIHREKPHLTILDAALLVLLLGIAYTTNTKITSRKDCRGTQFHFPFWKGRRLWQVWSETFQPLLQECLPAQALGACLPPCVNGTKQQRSSGVHRVAHSGV